MVPAPEPLLLPRPRDQNDDLEAPFGAAAVVRPRVGRPLLELLRLRRPRVAGRAHAALSTYASFITSSPPRRGCSRAVPEPRRAVQDRYVQTSARGASAARRVIAAGRAATKRPLRTPRDRCGPRARVPVTMIPLAISQSSHLWECMSHLGAGPRRSRRLPQSAAEALSPPAGAACPVAAPARARRRRGDWRPGGEQPGPAATRPRCARSFVGATQTNGDRATREQRGSTSHTLAAPGGSPQ